MRHFAFVVVAALAFTASLSSPAKAAPDAPANRGLAVTEVRGGFSKRYAAGTVAATLPKATPTSTPKAGIKVTVELGAD